MSRFGVRKMRQILKENERGQISAETDADGQKTIRRIIHNGCAEVYEILKDAPHPYMPVIYSVSSDGDNVEITEEYIEGRIVSEACFSEKSMISAAKELCTVLTHIHRLGIVHRDIKPSNILMAQDGHIRLIDFDAARLVKPAADSDTRYLGTDGFAPPEQYGFSQTDKRSDIYALGKTLECILGSLAFDKKYSDIIFRCTRLDPDERFSDADEVLKALNVKKAYPVVLSLAAVLCIILGIFIYRNAAALEDLPHISAEETADPFRKYSSCYKDLDFDIAERISEEDMEMPLLFETENNIPMEYIIIDTASLKENKYVSMLYDYNKDGYDDIFQLSAYKAEGHDEFFRSLCVSVVSMAYDNPDFHVISDNTYFPVLISTMSMNQETAMLSDNRYVQLTVTDTDGDGRNEIVLSIGRPDMFINTQIFSADNTGLEYSSSSLLTKYAYSEGKVFSDGKRLDDKEKTLAYMDLDDMIRYENEHICIV